jgi:hypothetical protein
VKTFPRNTIAHGVDLGSNSPSIGAVGQERDDKKIPHRTFLHDLILRKTGCRLSAFHGIAVALISVSDPSQAEGPTAVLVSGEFLC